MQTVKTFKGLVENFSGLVKNIRNESIAFTVPKKSATRKGERLFCNNNKKISNSENKSGDTNVPPLVRL